MRTWRQLEKLVDLGLVRHIGTSNVTIPKLELILRDARIPPAATRWSCTRTSSSPRSSGT
jgi:alcohol dehydrogenase (NADP+)